MIIQIDGVLQSALFQCNYFFNGDNGNLRIKKKKIYIWTFPFLDYNTSKKELKYWKNI